MLQKFIAPKNPLRIMFVIFIVSFGLSFIYKGSGKLDDSAKTLLTITSFVFGFYINNLISQARSRHGKVVESLREEGGYIKAIYLNTMSSFDKETIDSEREAIDAYLMSEMDYKVIDVAKSSKEFKDLYTFLMNMKPDNKQQEGAWGQIIRVISESSKARTRIVTVVKVRVSSFEWLTLSTLLALVIYYVYKLNVGSIESNILTAAIATTLIMLLVILYSLDSLRWKEDKWFWEPIEDMFTSLDLVPYYPKILVNSGRVKLNPGAAVRLAEYPNPYPDMRNKKVTKIES